MLRYPELLAWENLWHDSLRDTYAAMHAKVKSIKPEMGIGWHIWHTNSFSPIYRAEQDLQKIAPVSDFLKSLCTTTLPANVSQLISRVSARHSTETYQRKTYFASTTTS